MADVVRPAQPVSALVGYHGRADGDYRRPAHRRGPAGPKPAARALGEPWIPDGRDRHDGPDAAQSEDPTSKTRLLPLYADDLRAPHAIPGVEQVAAANAVPLDGGLPDGMFMVLAPQDVPKSHGGAGGPSSSGRTRLAPPTTAPRRRRIFRRSGYRSFADGCSTSRRAERAARRGDQRVAGPVPVERRAIRSARRSNSATWTATFGRSRSSASSANAEYGLEQPARPTIVRESHAAVQRSRRPS